MYGTSGRKSVYCILVLEDYVGKLSKIVVPKSCLFCCGVLCIGVLEKFCLLLVDAFKGHSNSLKFHRTWLNFSTEELAAY